MFDLRAYTVLLNEVFITGYDSDTLMARLLALLSDKRATPGAMNTGSSTQRQRLNSDQVVSAFLRVTGGRVRLAAAFSGLPVVSGKVAFVLAEEDGTDLLVLTIDGMPVCATRPRKPVLRH